MIDNRVTDRVKKILIVDDNPENIKVIAETLNEPDIKLAFAQSGEEALRRLEKVSYDLILMDVMMPEMDGFETVSRLKKHPQHAQTPVIFLTAKDDDESIETAFAVGGADYISKPFRSRELIVRVHHQLERKDFIERLDYLASKDGLTGVYNRRQFFKLATALFATHETDFYGVIIDIDHFKSVNDTHGHQVGDRVIRNVATTIGTKIPDEAILGRIGGEEFGMVFTSESLENARQLVENIRQSIEQAGWKLDDGSTLQCTISVGLTEKRPDMSTIDQLLQEADKALYGAKTSGRNRVRVRKSC